MKNQRSPIRVLHILRGGHTCGGIENFIMNYYRHIDRGRVQFDFLVHYPEKGYYDDEILELGGKIFCIKNRKNPILYMGELCRFFRAHPEYKIVHGHSAVYAPLYFFAAKRSNVPVRIAHSHANSTEPTRKGAITSFLTHFIKYPSNIYWACSTSAGVYMYGARHSFDVIPNAISERRFHPDADARQKMRLNLALGDRFTVGNVGRCCAAKNQSFLLQVFQALQKVRPEAVLLLIGEGELEKNLRVEAEQLGLEKSVCFIPPKANIEDYYRAMDVFVLPSLFEGFGIALVEAQACGVPCVTSNKVPQEVDLTGKIPFLSLDDSLEIWAEAISDAPAEQAGAVPLLKERGYNVEFAAEQLVKAYEHLYKGRIRDGAGEKDSDHAC